MNSTESVCLIVWLIGIPIALMVLIPVIRTIVDPGWFERITLNDVYVWAMAFSGALIWPAVLLLWLLNWAWKLFLMAWRRY